MKLNSIQFCWWQSRWYFPTFFRLTLKTSRCPFYYSSKWSWLEICLGSANSNPVPSKADLKALQHIFFRFETFIQNGEVQQDYSKHENMESLNFQTISEHISQSQVLPEVDRSHLRCHLQPPCLPSLPHAPLPPPSSAAGARATAEVPPYWRLHHASSWPWGGESWPRARPGAVSRLGFGGRQAAARWRKTFFPQVVGG